MFQRIKEEARNQDREHQAGFENLCMVAAPFDPGNSKVAPRIGHAGAAVREAARAWRCGPADFCLPPAVRHQMTLEHHLKAGVLGQSFPACGAKPRRPAAAHGQKRFTMRSSSEWKLTTTSRCSTSKSSASCRASTSSSSSRVRIDAQRLKGPRRRMGPVLRPLRPPWPSPPL